MNDTSATSQSGASLLPDGIGTLTAIHFVILAVVAIAVIAMIVAGIRRKRVRHQAAHEMTRNAEQAGVPAPSANVAAPPPPPVVEPAPTPQPAPEPAIAPDAVIAPEAFVAPEPAPLDDEPIAAAAPLDASPASEAAAAEPIAPPSAHAGAADQPVTLLKGLGPKVSAALAEHGITTVGQIASLDDERAAALDAELGPFRGRMMRDRWIEQARFLAAGDRAGFEAVFGKL